MKKYQSYLDSELISALKDGDERALTELCVRYWDKMIVVCLNRLNNLHLAQEIVQDVFTKIWERRSEICIKTTVAGYLAVAVKYNVINKMASKAYRAQAAELTSDYILKFEPSFEEEYFKKELMIKIEASIAELPEKCQLVFRLSRDSGLTNRQIAQKLGISEKTVEAHMSKAIKEIRSNLNCTLIMLIFCFFSK